jgi:small-conductance mechanosensitive channel
MSARTTSRLPSSLQSLQLGVGGGGGASRSGAGGNGIYSRPAHLGVAAAKILLTLLVVAAVFAFSLMVQDLLRLGCEQGEDHMACKRKRRSATIVSAAMTFLRTVLVFVGALVVLHHAGLRTTTLFALTSILSLVIGLAAQSMLRDLFNGATFLAEEQMLNGDYVQIITGASGAHSGGGGGGAGGRGGGLDVAGLGGSGGGSGGGSASLLSGIVENVSLRRIKLRNFDNEVIYVPNSEVRAVINSSQQYPVVRLRMSLSRSVDLDEALREIQQASDDLGTEPEFQAFYPANSLNLDASKASQRLIQSMEAVGMTSPGPELLGVSDVGAVGIEVMVRFMTDVGKQWPAGRFARQYFLRRLADLGPVTPIIRVVNSP